MTPNDKNQVWISLNILPAYNEQEKSFKEGNLHRLNGSVFCNMALDKELTMTFMNMTHVFRRVLYYLIIEAVSLVRDWRR